MTAHNYIVSKLEALKEPVARQDIDPGKLEEAILARVMSKKFRKVKADEAAINRAKKAIEIAVQKNEPVRLMLFFGGNKLWRLDEAPGIDWGELFSLIYYVNWAKYIAEVYEHGATIEYFSMDVAVERMNNVPHEETDQYSEQMLELLEWMRSYIPEGVNVTYTRMGDLYQSREAFLAEMDESKDNILKANDGKLPEMSEAKNIATELNVKLLPGQDEDPEWRARVELEHRGIFGTKTAGQYMSDSSLVPHCPTWYSGFVATGSTKRSLAKFWVGVGALEQKDDGFNDIILTPKQLETTECQWYDISIEGLEWDNFQKIRLV